MQKPDAAKEQLQKLIKNLSNVSDNQFIEHMLAIIVNTTGRNTIMEHVDREFKHRVKELNLVPAITPTKHPVTAQDFLEAIAKVQSNRGAEYEEQGKEERSFAKVAAAFSAVRGINLVGSDIALIQTQLKFVRQYSNPERIHHDSLLDAPSYTILWSSELMAEAAEKQQCPKTNPSSE